MSKTRIPVIVERNEREARFLGFRSGLLASEFEQPRRLEFKESDHLMQMREICEFLREFYPECPGVYLNYPVQGLFVREFSLPFIEKKKVKELVPLELDSILPYDPSEIVYDYQIHRDIENNRSHVISIAARRDTVERYIEIFNEYGIPLLSVFTPLDALYRLDPLVGAENYALFYVSSATSMIVIVREGRWNYSRIIPVGHDSLLKWLMSEWKKDYDESRQLLSSFSGVDMENPDYAYYKKHYRLTRPQSKLLLETITRFGDRMSEELRRTMEVGEQQKPEASPVVLITDTGNQLMVENLLSARLENPVDTFPYEKTQIAALGREYSLAVGFSIGWAARDSFNLLQGDLKKKARGKRHSRPWVPLSFLTAGVLLFLGSFGVDFYEKAAVLRKNSDSLRELYVSYFKSEPTDDLSFSSQAQIVVNKEREKTEIHMKFLQRPKISLLLTALNEALLYITDIDIERVEFKNEKLYLTASTDSFFTLESIKTAIKDNPAFKGIGSAKERSMPGADGNSRVKFSFEIEPKSQAIAGTGQGNDEGTGEE